MDNAFDRVEAVDQVALIAREGGFGRGQRGFHEVLCQRVAADETIHPIAGIIGVQGNDAIECLAPEFGLEQQNFRFL